MGVPLNAPVAELKVAHAGMLLIENDNVVPLGAVVVGVNEYSCCACAVVAGEPAIVGGLAGAGGAFTVIEKAGSEAV